MNVVNMKVEKLVPASYNPRNITKEMLAKLKKGIKQYGFVEPIVVNKDNTVIGGHQRLRAAMELGITEVPCVVVDLDKKNEKALNLALNKIDGAWAFDKLADMLREFEMDPEFDMELTGFDNLEALDLLDKHTGDFNLPDLGDSEGLDLNEEPSQKKGMVVQYTLVFNDEQEQARWHDHLRGLKEQYPDLETISERVLAFIEDAQAAME